MKNMTTYTIDDLIDLCTSGESAWRTEKSQVWETYSSDVADAWGVAKEKAKLVRNSVKKDRDFLIQLSFPTLSRADLNELVYDKESYKLVTMIKNIRNYLENNP